MKIPLAQMHDFPIKMINCRPKTNHSLEEMNKFPTKMNTFLASVDKFRAGIFNFRAK